MGCKVGEKWEKLMLRRQGEVNSYHVVYMDKHDAEKCLVMSIVK